MPFACCIFGAMNINSVKKLFTYYRGLGDKCLERLSFDQLKFLPHPESNSVAIMVKHMWGNMLSRWTDFLTSDGEKEWRKRDEEFIDEYKSKEEIIAHWNEGWDCLFTALDTVNDDTIDTIVYIRNEGHTIPEALQRQLAHYAYHVGQMVFLSKLIAGDQWESLSIPKGGSAEYNAAKFAQNKSDKHFTDDV